MADDSQHAVLMANAKHAVRAYPRASCACRTTMHGFNRDKLTEEVGTRWYTHLQF